MKSSQVGCRYYGYKKGRQKGILVAQKWSRQEKTQSEKARDTEFFFQSTGLKQTASLPELMDCKDAGPGC